MTLEVSKVISESYCTEIERVSEDLIDTPAVEGPLPSVKQPGKFSISILLH